MRILTVQWDNILDEEMRDYGLLLRVFSYSAKKHMPHATFQHIKIPPPLPEEGKEYFMTKNTRKLDYWVDAIKESKEDTIIMDCDMVILRDMSSAFYYKFDIGYSSRPEPVPLNGGVLFCRHSEQSIDFLEYWREANMKMYLDTEFHTPWRAKYAGMNQASLGYSLETYKKPITIAAFPCEEWNACQDDWANVDEEHTRCLHVKSKLRKSCLSGEIKDHKHTRAFKIWNKYLQEMLNDERKRNIC